MFWTHDYSILFRQDQLKFWIDDTMTVDEKLNAITRFVILLSLVGFIITQTFKFLWIGMITLLLIVAYKETQKPEAFTQPISQHTVPTKSNPLMNVLLPEINGDPKRKKALKSYTPETEQKIIRVVKESLPKDVTKGINNEMDLEYSMRNFYTTASTTIPNDQEGFGKFCYGDMISAKEGNEHALMKQNPRLGAIG